MPQPRAADEVFVYAHEGAELRDFLALVERFNRRSPDPTRWRPVVTTADDPLGRLVEERRGDVVVLAGRNGGKARIIRRLRQGSTWRGRASFSSLNFRHDVSLEAIGKHREAGTER